MVRFTAGSLIRCDVAMKQYLRLLDQTHKFILKDLGETELFVREDTTDLIKEEVEKFLDQHTFHKPELN